MHKCMCPLAPNRITLLFPSAVYYVGESELLRRIHLRHPIMTTMAYYASPITDTPSVGRLPLSTGHLLSVGAVLCL